MKGRLIALRGSVALAQCATVAAFFILWQAAADHHWIDPFFFSRPSDVYDVLRGWFSTGFIWPHLWSTTELVLVGYLLGTAGGIVLGLLLGTSRTLRDVASPFLIFFNAMPRLLLLPVLVIWFGFGFLPKIMLVVSVIVVVVAVNVIAGITEVSDVLLDQARLIGAGWPQLARDVYLPSIALWITGTARSTVGFAFNAAVAAEFIGATVGLGYLITYAQSALEPAQLYAALAVIIVLAFIIDSGLAAVESIVTRWMPSPAR